MSRGSIARDGSNTKRASTDLRQFNNFCDVLGPNKGLFSRPHRMPTWRGSRAILAFVAARISTLPPPALSSHGATLASSGSATASSGVATAAIRPVNRWWSPASAWAGGQRAPRSDGKKGGKAGRAHGFAKRGNIDCGRPSKGLSEFFHFRGIRLCHLGFPARQEPLVFHFACGFGDYTVDKPEHRRYKLPTT